MMRLARGTSLRALSSVLLSMLVAPRQESVRLEAAEEEVCRVPPSASLVLKDWMRYTISARSAESRRCRTHSSSSPSSASSPIVSFDLVTRVWDVLLCEGQYKIVYRVALALLKVGVGFEQYSQGVTGLMFRAEAPHCDKPDLVP
jgi:hypothetical protein